MMPKSVTTDPWALPLPVKDQPSRIPCDEDAIALVCLFRSIRSIRISVVNALNRAALDPDRNSRSGWLR